MKTKHYLLLLASCMSGTILTSCDSKIAADFNEFLINKITVGETINFNDYITYGDDLTVTYTYTNSEVTDQAYDSMYFITTIVSEHTFTFKFADEKHEKTISCKINVVPEAPKVVENPNAIYVDKDASMSFDTLFLKSKITALPFGHVDKKFVGVSFTEEYASKNVVISTETLPSSYKTFTNETSYTFDKYGKYVFDIDIFNSEGTVRTTLQVSVFDSYKGTLEGYTFDGLIKGNENVAELVKSNSTNALSYLYYDSPITLDSAKQYTMECEFVGKRAPQLILGADEKTGNKYVGKGMIISLEEDSKNQFGIYCYDRFNSANLSPSRNEGNTFSRKTLQDGQKYKWQTLIRVTIPGEGKKNIAIKSFLYKGTTLFRTYAWVSTSVDNFLDNSYFGYLGSSMDDALFTYSPLASENI